MNREFERLIDSLKTADRVALRVIATEPDTAWLCHQNVLWSLMRKKLVNVVNGQVEVTERGRRVVEHLTQTQIPTK